MSSVAPVVKLLDSEFKTGSKLQGREQPDVGGPRQKEVEDSGRGLCLLRVLADLKACHLLLCMDCQVKMLSIHQFQKTAIQGIRNLKYLLSKVNIAPSFEPIVIEDEDVKPDMITIKIEPGTNAGNEATSVPTPQDLNLLDEKNVKIEPQHPPETVPLAQTAGGSGSAVSCESARREPGTEPTTTTSNTKAIQTVKKRRISRNPANTAKTGNTGKYRHQDFEGQRAVSKNRLEYNKKRYKIKLRTKPTPLPCPHCDQKLSHACSLRAHINRKHKAEPSKCDECGATCRNAEALRHHKDTHKKEQDIDTLNLELFCAECAMHFPSRSAYDTHRLALKHTPREQYSFECQVCQKKFPKDRTLRQHIDVQHLGLRKHKCNVCGKVYARGATLGQHMRTAHEKRATRVTHVCDLCGKAFKVKRSLTEHLLTHQGLRPYQCTHCPATFSYNAALYNHTNAKHLNKKRRKQGRQETGETEKED
ncbi:zinc finger protein 354A-like [Cydia pomonella]|uniref:zinc finger protein 354A-like n=1 Tax=Cydia pomonella TaxID=82600 RepID=UPI002ADDACFB|nr:zinc finger protein 354A-like [Cydia pomonella]